MNMTDRWVCRRKVKGTLEVEMELWERGEVWEAVSTDHIQDHTMLSIPIGSCTDKSQVPSILCTHGCICTYSTNQHKRRNIFPCFLSAHKEHIYTYSEIDMHGHTRTPDGFYKA